ncbi:MAG TPA: IclR family transcriptional regulator [Anaerolineae bacterium]|nr:IclR family transcriptional regulator [Anaerolineae bacterium]HPL26835.1 IclR family transcriptional regulator [Anaerolineae bacterium]
MKPNESTVRAFSIIEYLAQQDDWVRLRALARDLGLHPATAYRFLSSLKDLGYVKQDPEGTRYQLTLKLAWIASRALERTQLRGVAHPWMKRLAAETNETTHLGVLDGDEVAYIDKVDSSQPVEMRSRIGARVHIHASALGKAIVAFLPERSRESIIEHWEPVGLTTNTIGNQAAFRQELGLVRSRGYAVDDEENEIGIRCIGAPIFDHTGSVVGALSVSGWTITMTPERIPQLAGSLRFTCAAVSQELGFRP